MTTMREQMRSRLTELKQEYQEGEARLRTLVQQESALRETLLRISGAAQVLEELLAPATGDANGNGNGPSHSPETGAEAEPPVMSVP
ncbi:hypothetical protein OG883_14140 [Streptomyces sp. NBC_01142]|uniref:hypothetical protein n=1 Tax=Streptomyces sp. NBC_01142 TaxID=2975865 RepID=UPI00224EDC35|nr:hypothetical protein [Streptomyces sp. NBC_01142]MCX4821033.1 hypothetical protein [Streptomyces sp. NBC_01142]